MRRQGRIRYFRTSILKIKRLGSGLPLKHSWFLENKIFLKTPLSVYDNSPAPYSNFVAASNLECEAGWTFQAIGSRTACFKHFGDGSTWTQARDTCASNGAELFIPLNKEENEAYYAYTSGLGYNGLWLDGNDVASEGNWVTTAGVSITWFNWSFNYGQPDNCCGGEDYLHYHAPWGSDWNDIPNDEGEHIMCNKQPTGKSSKIYFRGQLCQTSVQGYS